MSDYTNELNDQLKAVHARLDRVDTDLRSHFAAQYLQAISFAANPLTASQGALMAAQFASRSAFAKLADQIPGVEQFKKLQHLDASGLLDSLSSTLSGIATGIVETAVSKVESAITDKVSALRDYTTAKLSGAAAEILDPLETALNEATSIADSATSALNSVTGFMSTLTDITEGKTMSSVIRA